MGGGSGVGAACAAGGGSATPSAGVAVMAPAAAPAGVSRLLVSVRQLLGAMVVVCGCGASTCAGGCWRRCGPAAVGGGWQGGWVAACGRGAAAGGEDGGLADGSGCLGGRSDAVWGA